MKTGILVAAAVLVLAPFTFAVAGDSPGETVIALFDALTEGDGETAVSYLSSGTIAELQVMVDAMMMDPETAATELAAMGMQLEEGQLENLSAEEFGALVLSSPMIAQVMAMLDVSVGDVEITGDSAVVEVLTSMMGETNMDVVHTVLEDGGWKIVEMGI